MPIRDADTILDRGQTQVIGAAVDGSTLHSAARHPECKSILVVITAVAARGQLGNRQTSHFATPTNQCRV